MAVVVHENYSDLCRLCASKTNVLIGLNIFEGEGNVREINKKIATCLPIQVHESDPLPKMICSECVYKLDLFFNFRAKTLDTENLLIELANKTGVKETEVCKEQTAPAMDIVDVSDMPSMSDQRLDMIQNGEMIQSNMPLGSANLMVTSGIILAPQDTLHTSNLVSGQLQMDTLPPDSMVSDVEPELPAGLSLQQHTTMVQFVDQDLTRIVHSQLAVQNMELVQAQQNLMDEQYAEIQDKTTDDESVSTSLITLPPNQAEMVIVKEEVKNEPLEQRATELPAQRDSDVSDSDESSVGNYTQNLEEDEEADSSSSMKQGYVNGDGMMMHNGQLFEQQNGFSSDTAGSANTQWYYCNVCGKTLQSREQMMQHYMEHANKCKYCEAVFSNPDALDAHHKQMHYHQLSDLETKSIDSGKKVKFKDGAKEDGEYVKQEDSENELGVDEGADVADEDDDEDDEEGGDCQSGARDEADDDDGEDEEDDGTRTGKRKRWEPKVCKECGKSYKTNYKLAEHMRKHTGEQPYKCKMCDKAFRSKIGLAQHEAKHTGQYDYACPTCGKGFQCKSYLIVHQRVHSDLKPYPCTTCGRHFKTKQSLLDHMNRHLGVKPYLCETCGRGFITKGLCKSHQKVHSGTDNRQYPCSVCNKMFVSKSYLATHMRIHTGEKPFMCEVCGKGFLTRVDLRIHSTMHTGEKSFVCEICGKAFARRDALRCHRRSHTGERPYRCDICGQTFTQFSPMTIHKRLHTGERPYSCDVCSKTFVSRSTMVSHRKKHIP